MLSGDDDNNRLLFINPRFSLEIITQEGGKALVRRGARKFLARPGKKQATAAKHGIYSTYSPRSKIHFLASCSNFCKPFKKIQKFVSPTIPPWQQ